MKDRLIENVFFFGLLALAGYLVLRMAAPFFATLALAAIISVVWYPIYKRIIRITPWHNAAVASLVSVLLIALTIFVPLFVLGYMLFLQAASFYETITSTGGTNLTHSISTFEALVSQFLPGVSFDVTNSLRQVAGWFVSHMGDIFAGTASTVFMLFIMLVSLFYMLKDGPACVEMLIRMISLSEAQDTQIFKKLSSSIRSVVLGTLSIALIQGVQTSIGFALFGIPQSILWGSVASVGALIPGIGVPAVFICAVLYLVGIGSYGVAVGLGIWGIFAVGLIDNFLGPYLMSRGAELHPFIVLLSALGGIAFFGPVGLLLGPAILSFFSVLLELYVLHMRKGKKHA